jgi:Fur family peroxide stress response transcriptional regulator
MSKIKNTIEKLKLKKFKLTPQRIAIINFLNHNPIHPSAETIYNHIKEDYPTISLATIYNTLEKLEEIGELIKLKVSNTNKINYEFNTTPHQHFFCKRCTKIYDIWKEVKQNIKIIDGHNIEEVQVCYKGTCKSCNNSKDKK